jgi:Ca2+-binding RTX toxin-like protein
MAILILGDAGNNSPMTGFIGTTSDDDMLGLGGNDDVRGLDGNDIVNGNVGNDIVNGNVGDDTVFGGQGSDTVRGGKGNDSISGDLGNDVLYGDLGFDTLLGGFGFDVFVLSSNTTPNFITDFNPAEDYIGLTNGLTASELTTATSGGNTTISSNGVLIATLVGFTGALPTSSSNFTSNLNSPTAAPGSGTPGITVGNTITGGTLADLIGSTPPTTAGVTSTANANGAANSANTLIATQFSDIISGNDGNDTISGLNGNDSISGNGGDDFMTGGDGNDTVTGSAGNDTITGSAGADVLTGSFDSNLFVYTTLTDSAGTIAIDNITDFVAGTDKFKVAILPGGVSTLSITIANNLSDIYAGITSPIASEARLITVGAGAAVGSYLFINDSTTGVSATSDALIDITGVSGSISLSDFTT